MLPKFKYLICVLCFAYQVCGHILKSGTGVTDTGEQFYVLLGFLVVERQLWTLLQIPFASLGGGNFLYGTGFCFNVWCAHFCEPFSSTESRPELEFR